MRNTIFNVEYSPDGTLVVALCEDGGIRIVPASTPCKIVLRSRGHNDCANVVSFFNAHGFVTGSDDKTLQTWDLRKLTNEPVQVFTGHRFSTNFSFDL